jgi:beta-fructofuranosidase
MKRCTPARVAEFNEIMTLPRLLSLDAFDQLIEQPYGDYQSLRSDHQSLANLTLDANREVILPNIEGDVVELEFTIDLKKCKTLELNILRSPEKEEFTRIVFMREAGYPNTARTAKRKIRPSTLMLDATSSSIADFVGIRQPEIADFFLDKGELLHLHIFIDRSVVEVFANNRKSLVLRAYPTLDASRLVSMRAIGSSAELIKADAWQMKSIYKHKQ